MKEKADKGKKLRVDQLLVLRGLVESRETAQRLILGGKVLVGTTTAAKPGQKIGAAETITVVEGLKYVSRGGFKLEKALDSFGIDTTNKVVADIGASTGGFTDVLLQRGARKVFAVDVGYGQIAWKLRQDPRVLLMERTNARYLTPAMFAESIDLAVLDVSFISAHLILKPLAAMTGESVVLLKPQFEAGPKDVPRGGVVRDPAVHRRVIQAFYLRLQEWHVHGMIDSPIRGGNGNREFLLHLKTSVGWTPQQVESRIEELLA